MIFLVYIEYFHSAIKRKNHKTCENRLRQSYAVGGVAQW